MNSPLDTRLLAPLENDAPPLAKALAAEEMDGSAQLQLDLQAVSVPEEIVNSYRVGHQTVPAMALLTGGGYVTVWRSEGQDGSSGGVYAQRFNANGTAVGPEWRVNSSTEGDQSAPQVAGLSDGGFVVTWADNSGADGSGAGVLMQRYTATGVPAGSEQVATTFTSSTQGDPAVAAYTGGYAVVWYSAGNAGGNSNDIYLRRFDNSGTQVLAETRISTTPGNPAVAQTGSQSDPVIAARADGSLVIAWTDTSGSDGSGYGIYLRTVSASGVLSDVVRANTSISSNQYEPAVTMLTGGGFVVAWRTDGGQDGSGNGVYAQRFDASGTAVGSEFLVNQNTASNQYQPSLSATTGGGFAVAWYSDAGVGGTGGDVFVREFDASGVALEGDRKLVSLTNSTESDPALLHLGGGTVVVSYTDNTSGSYEIAQQILGPVSRQAAPLLNDFSGTVTFAENLVNATPQLIDAAVSFTDIDSADLDGGQLELYWVEGGSSADQLGVRSQGNGPGQIGVSGSTVSFAGTAIGTLSGGSNGSNLVITFNAAATVDAVEALVESLTYANTASNPNPSRTVALRISDGDGGTSQPGLVQINVTAELDGVPVAVGEEQLNTYTSSSQSTASVSAFADGSYVVVWRSEGQDGSSGGIYAQRFSANGSAVGPEWRVNSSTASDQNSPGVATLSDGSFVITWTDTGGVDGSGQGVLMQRYTAAGAPVGGEQVASSFTSSTQADPAVAAYTGGYAVVWYSSGNAGGNSNDIYLRRFDNSGNQVLVETRISTTPGNAAQAQAGSQSDPAIAARADGSLVIAWTDSNGNDGSGNGVYLRTVSASGTLSDVQLVNSYTTGAQYEPAVATLTGGGFVVVWRSDSQDGSSAGVYAQRFDAAGVKVGAEFLISETTTGGQYQPAVTGTANGGFVVTWYNDNYDVSGTGSTSDVYVREFDAAGLAIDGQRKLASPSNGTEYEPAIAHLGGGNFVVVYSDYNTVANGGNNTYDIAHQIFGSGAGLARQAAPVLGDIVTTVTFAENLINATPQRIDASVSLTDADSANFDGGRLDLFYTSGGSANDQLGVRNEGSGAGQIGVSGATVSYGGVAIGTLSGGANGSNLVVTLNANASVAAVDALVENLTYASTSSSPAATRTIGLRVSDGDGATSAANEISINVTPELDGVPRAQGEETVNTYTAASQTASQMGLLSDGGYITVWRSEGQDGSSGGIYAQRFGANGVAVGPEWRVNASTGADQNSPSVTGLSDGGFVITWTDTGGVDGSGQGVLMQRYTAAGAPVGGEQVANSFTSSTQADPAVAAYTGGYAVVWYSSGNAGGNSNDIYLRRFDNSGNQVLVETRISTTPGNAAQAQAGSQSDPAIAARADGSLVIAWTDSNGNDGSSNGVYLRTVSASGTLSDVQLVNSYTTGAQYEPAVATLSGGGFVVVWRSDNQDGSSAGVYAQRFDAAGVKVGAEFLISETTTGGQYQPAVTGTANGGFVVSWYNDNFDVSGTGSTSDVYVREFDAAGLAIDGQRKLVSLSDSTESEPSILHLGNGNFVVSYSDYATSASGGNNTYEIAQQVFGSGASLARQADPVVGDFTGSVTFAENLVNTTPQLIDASISLNDSDSANFDGGRLDLFYIAGGSSSDQLSVRHQGSGAGQIGVSGATVSYGGVAIGTISGGSNGSNLSVSFNANASVAAVEALVQNLAYANDSQSPAVSRTVALRISDGDGGSSAPGSVTINLTPEVDGRPLAYGEETVNSSTSNTQSQSQIAVLADGGWVVTWRSEAQDGAGGGIYSQRYAANGVRVGVETRVNTATAGEQTAPAVAALSDGGWVVTWTDQNNGDGSGQGVLMQRYTASGAAAGAVQIANSFTSSTQADPAVAGYTGGYAVVWYSSGNIGGNSNDIYLRRFDNSGNQVLVETRISTTPGNAAQAQAGSQSDPAIAARADGSLVIAWTDSNGNDGSSNGVYLRTVSASGTLSDVQLVNSYTTGAQYEPAVATLTGGGFVVVWRSDSQDGSSAGVYAQRFDANGVKVGTEFLVNESTSGGQYQPAVTGTANGGFVVSWYNDNYDVSGTGSTSDVYVREFDAAGLALDGQRKLSSSSDGQESEPAIAHLGNGNFVVSYSDYATSASGGNNTFEVIQQIFGSGASLARQANPVLGDFGPLRTLSSTGASPLFAGNAQRIDADVSISDSDSANFDSGVLTLTLSNGATATEALGIANVGSGAGQIGVSGSTVSYGGTAIGTLSGGGAGASSLSVTLNANATAAAVRALTEALTYQNTSPPAGTTDRTLIVNLTDGDGGSAEPGEVVLRIQASVSPAAVALDDWQPARTITEAEANAGVRLDDAVQLVYSGSGSFNGGKLTVSYTTGSRAADQLSLVNEGTGADQVSLSGTTVSYGGVAIGTVSGTLNGVNGTSYEITFNAAATEAGVERVIESLRYANSSADPLASRTIRVVVTDSTAAASTARDMVLTITPQADPVAAQALTDDLQANVITAGQQTDSALARLYGANAGQYVLAWTSDSAQDGNATGVFVQRYDANGAALGPQLRVNSNAQGGQQEASVTGLADGGYVISWSSVSGQDGSSYGVYAQRFGANGLPAGNEFRVNTSTLGNQYQSSVTGLADGSFVVAYYSDYIGSTLTNDVLAQRFAADGTPLGAEFTVNTNLSNTQYEPALARLGSGFVSVWSDNSGADGSGLGVYAQRFAADGSKLGAALLVNTTTAGSQQGADVAELAGGGFVVSWHSGGQAYAQRFDAAGNKVGAELMASDVDHPANYNTATRVTALESGGFVVAWDGSGLGGSGYDVLAQQFNASGAKVDGPLLLNSNTTNTQIEPEIVGLPGGGFAASWTSYNQEAASPSTYGVFHRVFGSGSLGTNTAPVLVDVGPTAVFNENLVNATPQLIDANVGLSDADSANFDGGRLWASIVTGYADNTLGQQVVAATLQDQLGLRSTGSGAGQVSVSGSSVSVGGVVVGSIISDGANGAPLGVSFNASATAARVEAVIEALTYANNSSAPDLTRTINITVSDGDGATSAPRLVTVTVNPEADSAQALFANARVNTFESNTQEAPEGAALAGGGYVIVWQSNGQDGNSWGVHGQRYSAQGERIGPEFEVNTQTQGAQYEPRVTGLAGGGFVVTWRGDGQDGSGAGIYAQRFAADATPQGGEFRVNTSTSGNQYQPVVQALADGGFVAAWYTDSTINGGTDYYDVVFQRFNAAGVPQGPETRSGPSAGLGGSSVESEPAIAALSGGGFVLSWTNSSGTDGSGYGVYAQRYDAAGVAQGAVIAVNSFTSGNQYQPSTVGLSTGGFVVTWYSANQDGSGGGIYAQRFDASGAKLGSEFRVNDATSGEQSTPSVTALPGGGFAVTWNDQSTTVVQQFAADGTPIDAPVRVDTQDNNSNAASPDVFSLSGGSFVVTWRDYNYGNGTYEVYQQVFGDPAVLTRQDAPVLADVASTVTFGENLVNATPQLLDLSVALSDADSANFDGGRLWLSVISGYGDVNAAQLPEAIRAQDQLGVRSAGAVQVSGSNISVNGIVIATIVKNGANGSDLELSFNANATPASVETLVEALTYANSSNAPVGSRTISLSVSDGDGGTSEPRLITVNVTPQADGAQAVFGNEVVNTFDGGQQSAPAVTRMADGGYVISWTSDSQDGWGTSVHGQRFAANGVPVGSEFQVNTYTPYNQSEATITGLTGGGFVVAWTSQNEDGSTYGVFAQRFDALSVPQGSPFLVNSNTASNQSQADIAALPGGGFVATWYSDSQSGEYAAVYMQRFDANGAKVGPETKVNTSTGFTGNYQAEPAVASFADGSFVIAFRSDGEDGSGTGVYFQRFAANGSALGAEARANSFTDGNQYETDVTVLQDGRFVIVWRSDNQDGSSAGIFGQRFAANGTPEGSEFRINTDTTGNETAPSITALSTGGFAVTYYDSARISVQQFAADGTRLDNETLVDTHDVNGNGSDPAIAALAGGAFVVTWQDYDYNLGNYQIFQQLYANPAVITRQADPQLVDVATSVTFGENLVNAVPQLIDPGVGLTDSDSANFDGGLLEVNYLTDYGALDQLGLQGLGQQDQLGIRHQGTGFGQIGLAGNDVSYGGVVIGTVVSNGANGAKLSVSLNANATPDAVEHLIENLTYANTVSNPIASRTVSIRVTDGDGGASEARTVTINVTPQTDGALPFGLERTANTTRGGQQGSSDIARLSSGGYVVTWQDDGGADGSGAGIYAQRFDANDNPVGSEFRVNTYTPSTQSEPSVAALSGGGFVVTWTSNGQDGSAPGIYAQRYAADGSAAGSEFRVNTITSGSQIQSQVEGTPNGGFIVVYHNDSYSNANTEYGDIFFQRYDAAGNPLGAETRANPPLGQTFLYQSEPSLAVQADGSFLIVWSDNTQDGNSSGIFGQRFTAAGVAEGSAFQVNSFTTNAQNGAEVTALTGGGYLVTWQSTNQDLSGWGVYAQRYAADGSAIGSEFRVNTSISNSQYDVDVAALANGGWVVTWYSDNTGDVYFQQYNAAGLAVDGETRANGYAYSTQYQPAVTGMPDGGFVMSWSGYVASGDGNGDGSPDGGNDTYEIRLQRFSNTAPTVSDVLVNGQEEQLITLGNAVFEAGFNDPDGQTLQAIKIITLPASGVLRLDGVAVLSGQEISLVDLQAGKLTYQGNVDYFGADQFRWTGSDGVTFASQPVFTNINLANVNDGPRLNAGADDTAAEGTFYSHAIVLGDPDPEGHQLTINWGDGTPLQVVNVGNALNHNISHFFADNGTYTVSVSANDQRGQPNSIETDSFTVTVNNVAPTLGLSGNANVTAGDSYTLTLGGVNDPGADTVTEYRIDWGDGTPEQVIAAASLPANRQVSHTYATSGNRSIAVTLVDEDGSFANAGTKAITVAEPAEVIVVSAGADLTVNEGTVFNKTISFTDPNDQAPAGRNYTVAWGDGTFSSGSLASGQLSFNISHAYADDGTTYSVVVTVDDSGAQQASDSFDVTVDNVAPTLILSGASTSPEGSAYVMTLTSQDPGADTISEYRINWGDGSPVQVVTAAQLPANRQVSHVYADGAANVAINVDVVDEDGTWANAGARNLLVTNVAPTAPVSGPATVAEGAVYALTVGAVTEPGTDTRTGYQIDWGDGSTDSFTPAQWAAAAGNFSHTYVDGGNGGSGRVINVIATDEDGSFVLGSQTVTVGNVAPTLALSGASSTNEGASYTLGITANDPAGANDVLSYSIDWGDGSAVQTLTAAQLAALSGNVTHTFADDEDGAVNATPRNIQVTVNDGDGGSTTQSRSVTVNNVAPTAPVSGAATVAEGAVYSLTVGAVADPGADTRTSYVIDWGDGSTDSFTPAQWAAAAGSFSHTFVDGGNGGTARVISVSATDEDDSFLLGSQTVTVGNVAPTLSLSGAASTNEGASYTLGIIANDPAGANDTLSYSIDWGDGSPVQTVTAAQLAALSGNVTHTFADDEDGAVNATPRNIQVTVNDGDGGSTTQSRSVTVNNVAPTAAVSGAATVAEGAAYALTVGAVADPGADTRTGYQIDWGDGTVESFTPAQWAAAAGSFSHTFVDGGNGGTARVINVSTTDEDGSFLLGSQAVTVGNVAPTVSLSGAASTNEGASYTLGIVANDPAGANDTLSYSIDWGDGSAVQTVTAAQLAALSGNVTHTFADDQDGPVNATPRNIQVTVNDGDGGSTTQSRSVTVNNVNPTIALGGTGSATAGQAYTLNLGAVTDPGTDTPTSYVIDWGDGTPAQTVAAGTASVTHTYAAAGNFAVGVSVVDEDGSFSAGSQAVVVNPASATLSFEAGPNATLNEGSTFTRTLTLNDGEDNGAAGWTYTIDYGDGTVDSGSTLTPSITLNHTYADGASSANVVVTVTDVAGESATDGFTVTVDNVAPTAPVSGAATVAEGAVYSLTAGAVADPGADTRSGYVIDWGDGSTDSFTPSQWAAAAGSFSHTFVDGGNGGTARVISVSATDEDGSFVLGSQTVTVGNVAPTLSLSGAASTNEGASYTLGITANDPAGANDTLSYSIDWGDGSPVQTVTAAQLAALSGNVTHTFADDEDGAVNATPRNIQVTVNDGDGGSTTQSRSVTVNNVAPTAAVSGAATVAEGAAYALTVGAVADPGADTRTGYQIDWGDGTVESFTPAQWAAAAGSFSHTFVDGGNGGTARVINVSTTDEDGSFLLGSQAVTVGNVAPTVSLSGAASTNEGASYTLGIVANDPAGANDTLSYSIDWGDGSAVQTVTAAQLAALSGNVTHTFADDQDGPVNATPRNIQVTVNDGDGGSTTQSRSVTVNNVNPTIALGGTGSATAGQAYTLNLGAVTDPGTDTPTSYVIDWGDGTPAQTVAAGTASVTHTYAAAGNFAVGVSVVDEDGSFSAGSQAVVVNPASATLSFEAGPNATLNEGSTFTRTLTLNDGEDNGAAGWTYTIDYGDGTVDSGSTLTPSITLNHTYADGASSANVVVTVTDVAGESATDGFTVTVDNVAPTAPVSGAATVAEGVAYTLSVGAVADPGADTRSGYQIDWGDGTIESFTPAQWAAAAGSFSHTFVDGGNGGTARVISVSATDEDGSFLLGSQTVTVGNVAPTLSLSGAASTNEGASYTLGITANDPAGANDTLSYSIDWGDGSPVQTVTAAQLAALSGNVTHTFADDEDGLVNATPRNIQVTVNDGDGGSTTQGQVVTVNNVGPTIALGGTGSATAGQAYTLNLGAVTDPGTDTPTSYVIDWGDGSGAQTVAAGTASSTHSYASAGNYAISVSVVDEDGSFAAGSQSVSVSQPATRTVRIGDAPDRQTGTGGQWAAAWTNPEIGIVHKADVLNGAEAWSSVSFGGAQPQLLSGNDIFGGDLGVSGQSLLTSTVRQELDGREGLRFNLGSAATGVTLNLSRFFINDDGSVNAEAGVLRLLDAQGQVVGQQAFVANSSSGVQQVSVSGSTAFTAVELWAGASDGNAFVFGAYSNNGSAVAPYTAGGSLHGSDYLVDWVEFTFSQAQPLVQNTVVEDQLSAVQKAMVSIQDDDALVLGVHRTAPEWFY
jgi:hypothetical protein